MRIPSLISFAGFIMIIVASYCPILHVILVNQNVYQLNEPFGLVFLLIAIVGILGTVFNNVKLIRLSAWVSAALAVLFYIAALLKIHTSFSFIPFNFVAHYLSKKITFRWGWYLLCVGALLALAGTLAKKQINAISANS
jgi:hypothetical protein